VTAYKYRAFISYSHADERQAARLHRALETFRLPSALAGRDTRWGPAPRRLTPIFRDRNELPAAGSLNAEIQAALKDSLFLIVVCSPRAAASRWVHEEIRTFKRLHGGGERVLAVIIDGEPGASAIAGRENEECFPKSLRFSLDEAGELTETPAEPIAADARKGKDGWRDAQLKLVAGLAGVGLDDVVQREAQRRVRNMTYIASASVALTAAMGFVTNFAVEQRIEAERARDGAEARIEFMLGDLKEKLQTVGRLDIMEDVGKDALAYYRGQNPARLGPDALGRRSRSLLLVGEIDNTRGDLGAALAAYEEAAKTTTEQLRRDPKNPKRLFDHAQAVYWVGYVAWQRGDLKRAEAQWREYLRLAEAMTAIEPRNPDYQSELGYAYSNLGTLLLQARRWDEALAFFEKSKARNEALVDAAPKDVQRRMDLAQDFGWIARAHENAGRFVEARGALAQEITFYDAILKEGPNAKALETQTIARNNIARVYLAEGRPLAAIALLKTAARAAENLLTADTSNKNWVRLNVGVYLELGRAAFAAADEREVDAAMARAKMLASQLTKSDSGVAEWTITSAAIDSLEASILRRRGQIDSAAEAARRAVNKLISLRSDEAKDRDIGSALARAELEFGDAIAQKDLTSAEGAWRTGLSALNADAVLLSPSERALAAELHYRLGRRPDALSHYNALKNMNYRHPGLQNLARAFEPRPQ
jgi:tetratricopeptide (TPR) repeat protein